ncbi:MAG: hypothetical protein ACK6DV_19315, partial [Deltaproteobacteria bacterium]
RVLRAQWHRTQETSLEWRIERARLPDRWTLESFPWKKQPGVSQKQITGATMTATSRPAAAKVSMTWRRRAGDGAHGWSARAIAASLNASDTA